MIITLPRHDNVTEYLSQFSTLIIEEAEAKLILIKKLEDGDANLKEFSKTIKKLDYNFIVLNGHGSDVEIWGQKCTLLKLGLNEDLLKNRIVYARSCHAAKKLGIEAVKNSPEGCFIGYDRPFQFYINEEWVANPLKDNLARLFLEPANLVPISLIKGNTADVANENSKNNILKQINKILKQGSEGSFQVAEALWNNYFGQVIIGNKEAKI